MYSIATPSPLKRQTLLQCKITRTVPPKMMEECDLKKKKHSGPFAGVHSTYMYVNAPLRANPHPNPNPVTETTVTGTETTVTGTQTWVTFEGYSDVPEPRATSDETFDETFEDSQERLRQANCREAVDEVAETPAQKPQDQPTTPQRVERRSPSVTEVRQSMPPGATRQQFEARAKDLQRQSHQQPPRGRGARQGATAARPGTDGTGKGHQKEDGSRKRGPEG